MIASQPTLEGADSGLAAEVMREYGRSTRVALARYLHPREPQRHLYSLVADYPRRGGRMLRASLCIATARVHGAGMDEAVQSAAALELLHSAFLVHDDVEDESELRRGRPTLHESHGVAMAVNAGDALTLLALRALADNRWRLGSDLTLRLLAEVERAARESVEGQAMELGWRADNDLHLGDADYFAMVLKKTCWYTTILPSRLGALVATRSDRGLDRFIRFGFFLGLAFQIQDDLLNLAGDEARYGKELGGDVLEGKRTLMVIDLLRHLSGLDRARLGGFLSRGRQERSQSEAVWVLERLFACGSVDRAQAVAHGLAGAAAHEAGQLYGGLPDTRDRRFLLALPSWVLSRAA